MGERIWFATSNWSGAPNKPSCYSQAQWDARNSSKFNGLPFATLPVSGYTDWNALGENAFEKLKQNIQSIPVQCIDGSNNYWGGCSRGQYIFNEISKYSNLYANEDYALAVNMKELPCDKQDYKIWDGSTFYSVNKEIDKNWSWTVDTWSENTINRSVTYYANLQIKVPSNSTSYITPVCGPGTHIVEISKDLAMNLVWRAKELEIDTASINFTSNIESSGSAFYQCWDSATNKSIPINLTCSMKASQALQTTSKKIGSSSSSTLKESDILSLKWDKSSDASYTYDSTKVTSDPPICLACSCYDDSSNSPNTGGTCTYTDSNIKSTIQYTVTNCQEIINCKSNFLGNNNWQNSYLTNVAAGPSFPPSNDFNISLQEFKNRQYAIITTQDNSGNIKYFLDVKKLLNFSVPGYGLGNEIYIGTGPYPGSAIIEPQGFYGNRVSNLLATTTASLGESINIILFGETISVPVTKYNTIKKAGDTSYIRSSSLSGSITIKAKSYYEYATSKGEAVYDKTTGNQLRDPLS